MAIAKNKTRSETKKRTFTLKLTREQAVSFALLEGGGYHYGKNTPDRVSIAVHEVAEELHKQDPSVTTEQFDFWKSLPTSL